MATPSSINVPSSSLETILNFRDVGQTINGLLGQPVLREGLLFRSARPDGASPADRKSLSQDYHIKLIIDLRSTTELVERAKHHDAKVRSSALVPQIDSITAEQWKIPGVAYNEINLNGGAFSRALLWKLRWGSLTKLLALMAAGYRMEAISILGREVMAPRGLIGLGKDTLDHSKHEIHRVFTLLSNVESFPVLIHCTQGKDRTGLIIVLILILLEVPVGALSADYTASERLLEAEKDQRLQEIRQIGLGDEFAGCPIGFVEEIKRYIDAKFGGIDAYIENCKIDVHLRATLKKTLTSQE